MAWPFFKTYKWKCPDGSVKVVYRNVDDAFPIGLRNVVRKLKAEIPSAEANIGGEYSSSIEKVLFDMNGRNDNLIVSFRTAYELFKIDPCKNEDYLKDKIDALLDEQQRINEAHNLIVNLVELARANPKNPDIYVNIFRKIADMIGGPAITEAAKLEIDESRNMAEKWIKE